MQVDRVDGLDERRRSSSHQQAGAGRCHLPAGRRMSLISDALKTAQRERSGQTPPGSGDQPLLDGFFPYVSTSAPSGRSQRTRIAMISVWSLVGLVLMAFTLPLI